MLLRFVSWIQVMVLNREIRKIYSNCSQLLKIPNFSINLEPGQACIKAINLLKSQVLIHIKMEFQQSLNWGKVQHFHSFLKINKLKLMIWMNIKKKFSSENFKCLKKFNVVLRSQQLTMNPLILQLLRIYYNNLGKHAMLLLTGSMHQKRLGTNKISLVTAATNSFSWTVTCQ